MYQSQFKELSFLTEEDLDNWLNETTSKVIHLEDYGQDMQTMWIHGSGEILYCDFNFDIYNGKFVDMPSLEIGNCLNIWDEAEGKFVAYNKLIIESIADIK